MRCLPLSSALIVHPALAAKWDIVPTLGIEETYTDNLRLSSTAKQSDWATVLTPGISVNATGARLRLNLGYSFQSIAHSSEGATNQQNHQLSASATAEALEKLAYVDARASVSQVNTSILGPQAVSNVNITGNRSTAATFLLSPYLRHRFGSDAEGEARYTYSVVDSDSGTFGRTDANRLDLRLNSGPSYRLYTWNIAASKEKITGAQGGETEFGSIQAAGRRLVTYNLYLTSSVGYEENNYVTLGGAPNSGMSWSTGIDWTPTPRTRLAATLGKRYYGDSYSFDFSHRTRLTVWNARYSEDVTTARSQLLIPVSTSTAAYVDSLLLTKIPDPIARQAAVQQFIIDNGLPPTLLTPTEVFTNRVTLIKRWQASAGLQGVRHTLLGNLYWQTQDAQSASAAAAAGDFSTSNSINQAGGSATWSWRMTHNDSSNLSVGYTRSESPGLSLESNQKYLRAYVTHIFDPKLSGALAFRRLQSDSNQPGAGYTENAVTATLQMRF